jgi:hypothetical protein
MENKKPSIIESTPDSKPKQSKKPKFELPKIPKISESLFNALASLSILTGSVLTAQSAFAEMKTGVIISNKFDGFGSSVKIFDENRECVVTNEHVVDKTRNNPQETEYYNVESEPLLVGNPILNSDLIPNQYYDTYPGKYVIYPSFFDAAVMSNPDKPCTKEFIEKQIGSENILSVDKLIKRNKTEFKSQTIKITTNRNKKNKNIFDNKTNIINGRPLGVALRHNNQLVFLNFSESSYNEGLDPNQFLLPGASGSPSYTKHKDGKVVMGLQNTVFTQDILKNCFIFESNPGIFVLVNTSDRAEFINNNPQFKVKEFQFAEDFIFNKLKEFGYLDRQDFVDKKGTIFGITPFFSKEGLDQIPSEKDLPKVVATSKK